MSRAARAGRGAWRCVALSALAFLALLVAFAGPAFAERRVALVIGNSTYKNVVALTNPKNDAEDVATTLRDLGFEVMIRTDVEKNAIRPVLKDFSRLVAGADTALVYYAGHALQYQGRFFLMPTDAALEDEDALKFDMLPADDIREVLNKVAGIRIMIFDACRNDPFTERPALRTTPTAPQGQTRGLTRVMRPQGSIVAFATAPFDVAEDGKARNSPFTRAFLKWSKEPGLEITQMFRRVTKDVFDSTGGRQAPEITISLLEEYYLNRTESDRMFWARIRWSSDIGDFRDFLSRFPASEFAPDARFRLQVLDEARKVLEEARRKEEAAAAAERERKARERQEQACAAEAARVAELAGAGGKADLTALKQQAECPATAGRVDQALAALATREAAEKARAEAEAARIAREELCRKEAAQIDAAAATGKRPDLQALVAKATCPESRGRIDTALAEIGRREAAEKQRLEAEAAQKAREAQEKAEAAAKLAREEACRKEETQIDQLATAGRRPDLQAIAAKTACPDAKGRIETALAAIAAREVADKQRLDAEAAQKAREAQEKAEAAAKLAREEACRKDEAQVTSLTAAGRASELQALAAKSICPDTRGRVDLALAEIGKRELAEKQRQELEAAQKAREAQEKAEAAARVAKEEACRKEAGQIDGFAAAGRRPELQALVAKTTCADNRGRIDTALADLARREEAAARDKAEAAAKRDREAAERQCETEQAAFDRLDRGLEAKLSGFAAGAKCPRVLEAVNAEIERLRGEKQAAEEVCVREAGEVERLRGLGEAAREELGRFAAALTCARLKPVVLASLEVKPPQVPDVTPPVTIDPATRITRAETALKRLGCYDGAIDARRESQALDAARTYLRHRGQSVDRNKVVIDETLLARLEAEPEGRVCPLVCGDNEVVQDGRCVEKKERPKPKVAEPREPRPPRAEPKAEPKAEARPEPPKPQQKLPTMLGI
ncbi:hypothetical protein EYW49_13385 [Siculibacillus lacustris]|uniref:Caspase family p20 domain-containing protein n=1 Tax=Siculibacillus lacustris TaxID=1549641 RepID=A0A4Q9VNZ6_9HYPH|nr:caspase family protein [Siculibacillus lacustris]TBW36587.1 hypothetical protein EYW49_13385 [Siculibacillus lacustris]